jgi:hypothetical protein
VRKTFHVGPQAVRARQAQEELTRLERFAASLEDVPGVACPRPLELLSDPPGLRMAHAPGANLFALLGGRLIDASARERLATPIAAAVAAYVGALGEPLPDFKFDNLLYDAATDTLTFVDLGAPQDAVAPAPGLSPYEISAGDMLASVVFQSARPRHALERRRHAHSVALAVAVVRALRATGAGPLRDAELAAATAAAYRRCAFGRSARRSAWYATAGYALGRRIALGSVTVGPVAR